MKNLFILTIALAPMFVFGATTENQAYIVTKVVQSGNFFPPVTDPTLTTKITFLAKSTGCTTAKDFEVSVAQEKEGQFVTLKRVKADTCKRAETTVAVTVTTTELEHSTVTLYSGGKQEISNPIFFANPAAVVDQTSH